MFPPFVFSTVCRIVELCVSNSCEACLVLKMQFLDRSIALLNEQEMQRTNLSTTVLMLKAMGSEFRFAFQIERTDQLQSNEIAMKLRSRALFLAFLLAALAHIAHSSCSVRCWQSMICWASTSWTLLRYRRSSPRCNSSSMSAHSMKAVSLAFALICCECWAHFEHWLPLHSA